MASNALSSAFATNAAAPPAIGLPPLTAVPTVAAALIAARFSMSLGNSLAIIPTTPCQRMLFQPCPVSRPAKSPQLFTAPAVIL